MRVVTNKAVVILVAGLAGVVGGCATTSSTTGDTGGRAHAGKVVQASKPTQASKDAFAKLRGLEGEWESQNPETGAWGVSSVIKVTSNGSVVREIMFPGTPSEMTNMYHLDGDSIVATHYCAMGNQPQMRSTQSPSNQMHFVVSSVTNLADSKGMYMGDLKLTFVDADNIVQDWRSYDKGVLSDVHNVGINLRRKK